MNSQKSKKNNKLRRQVYKPNPANKEPHGNRKHEAVQNRLIWATSAPGACLDAMDAQNTQPLLPSTEDAPALFGMKEDQEGRYFSGLEMPCS
ncbi:MAG: hypothetical protein N3G22_01355 [Candidatus Micrarchaeota archaeon]|nr:hypothetical protein [Candidatus Micrarchaeota archaeon]